MPALTTAAQKPEESSEEMAWRILQTLLQFKKVAGDSVRLGDLEAMTRPPQASSAPNLFPKRFHAGIEWLIANQYIRRDEQKKTITILRHFEQKPPGV